MFRGTTDLLAVCENTDLEPSALSSVARMVSPAVFLFFGALIDETACVFGRGAGEPTNRSPDGIKL